MRFIFCLHYHQPPGNFPEVYERAYQQAYRPVLETIAAHPTIKVVLHHSGCLLEDDLLARGEYIDRLRELVDRGQVELLSSPIYEPVLSVIPERDRLGQLRSHQDLLERTFGVVPRGMWLPERVWEPSLPRVIGLAGLEYLPLDDTPFLLTGLPEKRLYESYVTEEEGLPVRVFPVPRSLRHLIPSARPEEVLAQLLRRQQGGARLSVFADAGEKFGLWPGTSEAVVRSGWLSKLFSLLEGEQHRIQTSTFEEYVDTFEAAGLLYLPSASYGEMLEWSIAPAVQRLHHKVRTRLEQEGEGLDRMLGMGHWRNFFVRYPESNWMHKRGLELGRRMRGLEDRGADPEAVGEARRHLWRSQSHAAYWHGASGGLYAPHLRDAVHRHQITAGRILDRLEHGDAPFHTLTRRDLDLDGAEEVVLANRHLALTLAPADGGTLVALDDKRSATNLLDTVARREESYHDTIRDHRQHDRGRSGKRRRMGGEVSDYLNYDPFPLYSLRAHFLPEVIDLAGLQDLRTLSAPPSRARFDWQPEEEVRLAMRTTLRPPGRVIEYERRVALFADEPVFGVSDRLHFGDRLPDDAAFLALEWTLGLGAPGRQGRHVVVNDRDPRAPGADDDVEAVRRVEVVDRVRGVGLILELTPEARLLRFPVNTMGLSFDGPERVFQGTRLFFLWPLDAALGSLETHIRATVTAPELATTGELEASDPQEDDGLPTGDDETGGADDRG
jgi:alpha-amylase